MAQFRFIPRVTYKKIEELCEKKGIEMETLQTRLSKRIPKSGGFLHKLPSMETDELVISSIVDILLGIAYELQVNVNDLMVEDPNVFDDNSDLTDMLLYLTNNHIIEWSVAPTVWSIGYPERVILIPNISFSGVQSSLVHNDNSLVGVDGFELLCELGREREYMVERILIIIHYDGDQIALIDGDEMIDTGDDRINHMIMELLTQQGMLDDISQECKSMRITVAKELERALQAYLVELK